MKKQILLLFLFTALSTNLIYGEYLARVSSNNIVTKLSQDKTKKILIFYNVSYPKWGFLPWFLYDPLILSEANIEVTKVASGQPEGSYPDLSSQMISSYDLVIVPYPHRIKQEYITGLLSYLDNKGALFLVQPIFDSPGDASRLLEKLGVTYKGTEDKTPASSLLTDHPSTRILGLPGGKSVYPHRMYQPHMKFEVGNGTVLTRLSYSGEPDLFMTSNGRVAIVATDILSDLEAHHRGAPEFYDYRQNIGYLFINTVRGLLGFDFFRQPVQEPQQRWSDFFYAYAAGREYVLLAREEEPFSGRLSKDELKSLINKADSGIEQAAKLLVQGKFEECKTLYDTSVKLLSGCMDKMTKVDRYIIRGWHASILTPDYYGGGLLGYAETEWMDHLINWMRLQVDWITRTGSRRLINIYPNDWDIMAKYYQKDVQLFKEGIKDGLLEPVHGIYTAAYLPILPEECNVRQFSYGLKVFENLLDTKVETYLDAADHYDFHPQLPQLLKNFGYKYAILQPSSYMSTIKPILADKIRWRGLDSSELEAVPTYEGILNSSSDRWTGPELAAKADRLGYKTILLGHAIDATSDPVGEKEHSILNPIAPVAGKWVTAKEFFERTPKAEQSFYLGVDDLYSRYLEHWSSWGCMNEAYEWNRTTENKILAAEKFSVIASVLGKTSVDYLKDSQAKLDESWKNLLRTQDHMTFGPVDYTNQIPPVTLKPGEDKKGKHAWGYQLDLLPRQLKTIGAMENYGEEGSDNYAGPMIPGSRYERVKKFIKDSQNIADTILIEALGSISGGNKSQPEKDRPIPVTIYNQLGWGKNDIATVEKEFREGEILHFALYDGKKEIPYQVDSIEKYGDGSIKKIKALFLADIPSLGYKTYFLKLVTKEPATVTTTSSLKATSTRLENDYYIVEINAAHGGITRIFDKKLGVELLSSNQVGNELFSPAEPIVSSIKNRAKTKLTEKGPLRVTTVVKSKIGEASYECAISLYKDLKRIDFNLIVDYGKAGLNFGKFEKDGTGLFVRFPLNFTGKLYVNQPFGIYETKKERQVTLDFADLYQGQYGLSLIHKNTPAYQYKQGILSIILAQGRPLVVGKQNYQYSIYTHKDDPFQGDSYNIAKSVNTPFIVYWPEKQGEGQSKPFSFLIIDKPNIVLSALYSEGNTIYARFYERSGKETTANIDLHYLKSAECNKVKLNREKVQKIQNVNGKVQLDFKPWEIITLTLSNNLHK